MFNQFRSYFTSSNEKTDSNFPAGSSKEEESLGDEFFLVKKLNEQGKFAYAGLCTVVLQHLFSTRDINFAIDALKIITNNLALDEQSAKTLEYLFHGKFTPMREHLFCFLNTLNEENAIDNIGKLIVQDLLSLALLQGHYDARWRALIKFIASELDVKNEMEKFEIDLADFLLKGSKKYTLEEMEAIRKNKKREKIKRYSIMTGAIMGSAALIGLSGGLAAPLIVETVIPLLGATSAAATLASLSAVTTNAIVGGIFGTAGASLVGYKLQKRIGDIKDFKFRQLDNNGAFFERDDSLEPARPNLSYTIAISGWISDQSEDNFALPWKKLNLSREQYCLYYESKHLLEVGNMLEDSITSDVMSFVKNFTSYNPLLLGKFTVRSSVPGLLLGLTSVIDIPWSICCSKAILVGKELAEVLLARKHGHRPVTLIGYSFGARVIYYCLLEMLERDGRGIIEDVYLIGAPCPADPSKWSLIPNIVAGRITNAFSSNDSTLKYLYSLLSLPSGGPAGIKPINVFDQRIKNIDISSIIKGHGEYPDKLDAVLKKLDIKLIEKLPELTSPSQPGPSKINL